jgi:hypothetical protein
MAIVERADTPQLNLNQPGGRCDLVPEVADGRLSLGLV